MYEVSSVKRPVTKVSSSLQLVDTGWGTAGSTKKSVYNPRTPAELKQGARSRKQEAGSKEQEARSKEQEARSRKQEARKPPFNVAHRLRTSAITNLQSLICNLSLDRWLRN